jgi:hypothetical protein
MDVMRGDLARRERLRAAWFNEHGRQQAAHPGRARDAPAASQAQT